MKISGQLVDVVQKAIKPSEITVEEGKITSIVEKENAPNRYIIPPFVDAHIHIESSMMIPSEFARIAVIHGTVASVSDPHEIANVCGIPGVDFMIENGGKVPFKFYFGASPCVPATQFETSGAELNSSDVNNLLRRDDIFYLAEVMNYPAVINGEEEILKKIQSAKQLNKVIDGHAPGLTGNEAVAYIRAGISTDHECFSYDEARFKLENGMKIIIREGSAARNFDALIPLLAEFPEMIMFCSDDKHPDELLKFHINDLVSRALNMDYDLFNTLRAASFNSVKHYNLNVGLLQLGDPADFLIVDSLSDLSKPETYIEGELVAKNGVTYVKRITEIPLNNFNLNNHCTAEDFAHDPPDNIKVIVAKDGELVTEALDYKISSLSHRLEYDILKIVVVNRYVESPPSIAYIKNFGLKEGAIASSVAHDSHNIICVGTSDQDISNAVNLIIDSRGGISIASSRFNKVLPLPLAGLMSLENGFKVAKAYEEMDQIAKSLGSKLKAPFMTLSFMALLVIPELKLSDKGLFNGKSFEFVDN